MSVGLALDEHGTDGVAFFILDALAHSDMAAALLVVHSGDVLGEAFKIKWDFGDIDELWAVGSLGAVGASGEGRCGGEKAGVPAHDDIDLDSR